MTETAFLPGPGGSDVDNPTMTPPFDAEDEASNRRRLMIIGGAAGIVVLLVAAFLLLHKGGGTSAPTTVPRGTPHSAPASAAPGHQTKTLPKRGSRATARDPFQALVAVPVGGGTAAGATTTVAAGTTVAGGAPTTSLGTPPTTAPATGSGNGSLGTPLWIELLRTKGSKSATFKIGYHHHTFRTFVVDAPNAGAQQGTVFANDFALIGVQDGTATVQVGDATPFDLEPGFSHPL